MPDLHDGLSTAAEARRLASELELEAHLAAMAPGDCWRVVEPRLLALVAELEDSQGAARAAILEDIAALRAFLDMLRADFN